MYLDIFNNIWISGFSHFEHFRDQPNTRSIKIPNIKAKKIAGDVSRCAIIDFNDNAWSFDDFTVYENTEPEINLEHIEPDINLLSLIPVPDELFDEQGEINHNLIHKPKLITDVKIKDIAIDQFGLLMIDLDDNVWIRNKTFPSLTMLNLKAQFISINYKHAAIIDLENNLWTFGDVEDGKLGISMDIYERNYTSLSERREYIRELNERYKYPTLVPNIKVKYVTTGRYH